jgi:hypothetical protein
MAKYYVYVDWTLEEISRPFYVGKGSSSRLKILKRNQRHTAISEAYGMERKIVLETDSEEEAFVLEKKLIQEYSTYAHDPGSRGANYTLGGEGSSGRILSKESIDKIRRPHGPKHSESQRLKWSQDRSGKKISDSHREKIRLSSLGRNHDCDTRDRLREISKSWWEARKLNSNSSPLNYKTKAVEQIDPATGEVIKTYDSMSEAARDTGCKNISRCCRGLAKTSGGYAWRYRKNYEFSE